MKNIKNTTKNIPKKQSNIDPMVEARKGKYFQRYLEEARLNITIGIEVYNTREALKMSQQELAKQAKTTQKVISNIENGDVNVGSFLLKRIGKVLKFNNENWGRIFGFANPAAVNIFVETANNRHEIEEKALSNAYNYYTN